MRCACALLVSEWYRKKGTKEEGREGIRACDSFVQSTSLRSHMRFQSPVTRTRNASKTVLLRERKSQTKTKQEYKLAKSLGTWIQQYRAKVS